MDSTISDAKRPPIDLGERYLHYKKATATATVTDWLRSLSPPLLPPSTGRRKGKDRKLEKAAAKLAAESSVTRHDISVRELLKRAQFLNTCAQAVSVPMNVQRVLARAIRLRKDGSEWYQRSTGAEDTTRQTSSSTHEYFIQYLERVETLLQPRFELYKPVSTQQKPETPEKACNDTNNQFEALELPEDEEDLDIESVDTETAKNPSVTGAEPKEHVYNLETGVEDIPFMVWCFFEDLHKVQDFLKLTWQKVTEGKLDVATAAITTDMAMELVQQAEEALVKAFLTGPAGTNRYAAVLAYLGNAKASKNPEVSAFAYGHEYLMLDNPKEN
ncbi:uncharacterized protein PAC_06406 [Phialocephala subalpina]|uniref:DUF6604 domain-containing protein n=1 Tax=Phialocephala subalpina TaxID=576137 RepID=A0A1L7WUR5_9HELO|nr:uncharacterized protein PAC_06406 [Phialocephala subalpina]